MKKISLRLLLIFLFGVFLILLSPKPNPSQTSKPSQSAALEVFLEQHKPSDNVADAYRIALANQESVISTVKCYCGCIEENGHRSNRDCFINEDGSFDLMGLNCGICVKTALTAQEMLNQGRSVAEISDYVDKRWGNAI